MYQKIIEFIASKKFFYLIVAFFVLEAAWIALSGAYPMAFDEDFHLGVIRLYAHHVLPFWSGQPPNADVYGAVFRDPSYLYHYLMSFPYRLVNLFTHDTTIQVIILRFINIALFAGSLPLYHRLLLRVGASKRVVNIILMLFVLLPVVPLLAGQINYDNMLIPLVALVLLLSLRVHSELRQTGRLNMERLVELVAVALLASLVKYAFLPILLAIAIFLVIEFYRYLGRKGKFWRTLGFGITLITPRKRWVLVIALIISVALFTERYGVNLVNYHTPVPSCDQVLSIERCKAYGPWSRDYSFAQIKPDLHDNPLTYTADWMYGMWLRTFFAVAGPATTFETRGPLILPAVGAIIFGGIGLLAEAYGVRRTLQTYDRSVFGLLGLVTLTYAAALWLDNYRAYIRTGQPVAINGRYLIVIYPLIMMVLALGYKQLLAKRPRLLLPIASLAVICFLIGGGTLTFILRSRDAWLWPNSAVRHVNYDAKEWLAPFVPGSNNPIEYLPGS